MESIGISEFKAKCIAILKQVQANNQVVTVTHRGKPLVRIKPIPENTRSLGGLSSLGEIKGELLGFDFDEDWEMSHP